MTDYFLLSLLLGLTLTNEATEKKPNLLILQMPDIKNAFNKCIMKKV